MDYVSEVMEEQEKLLNELQRKDTIWDMKWRNEQLRVPFYLLKPPQVWLH